MMGVAQFDPLGQHFKIDKQLIFFVTSSILHRYLDTMDILRWPNTVFARVFADAIQHVHKDFKKQACRQ